MGTETQLNTNDLRAILNKEAGLVLTDDDITMTIACSAQEARIIVTSANIVGQAGVMAAGLKRLTIKNFCGDRLDTDANCRYGIFWVPFHFEYELKGGGTNGFHLLTLEIQVNNKYVVTCGTYMLANGTIVWG